MEPLMFSFDVQYNNTGNQSLRKGAQQATFGAAIGNDLSCSGFFNSDSLGSVFRLEPEKRAARVFWIVRMPRRLERTQECRIWNESFFHLFFTVRAVGYRVHQTLRSVLFS